jgi:P-type Cu2+ transporter
MGTTTSSIELTADRYASAHPHSERAGVDAVAWDDTQVQQESTQLSAIRGHAETVMRIEGMHCAACALSIEKALTALRGVQSARVSAACGTARVTWQPVLISLSRIAQTVVDAGYAPYPMTHARSQSERVKQQRLELWRLFVAGLCMMQVMMYSVPMYVAAAGEITADISNLLRWAQWMLMLPVLLFSAAPFFKQAWVDVSHRRVGMDVPVALGIVITFVVSSIATFNPVGVVGHEVYFDSLTMFVFFLLCGRYIEARARSKTAGALEALMQRMPRSVERFMGDWRLDKTRKVPQSQLIAGDVVRIASGQAFVGDGEVLQGQAQVDEALLTGESRAQLRGIGDAVLAGSVNKAQAVIVRLTRLGEMTRYAQIVQLMQRAATDKPAIARLADRIAGPFVVLVVVAALAAGVVWWWIEPARAALIAATVLIVTCPCALSLATPAAMLAAAGNLANRGVLVQRLQAFETLAQVDLIVFDKTGTLTQDHLNMRSVVSLGFITPDELKRVMARARAMAKQSMHPVARAVSHIHSQGNDASIGRITDVYEEPGKGIRALFDDDAQEWRLGSYEFTGAGTFSDDALSCFVSRGGVPIIRVCLDEAVRSDAAQAVKALRSTGATLALLSGDRELAVQRVARELSITNVHASNSPEEKLQYISEQQQQGHIVAMVGDGINDAPVLAKANVSFALGDAADITRAQADFVVLSGRVSDVAYAQALARRTLRIVKQNLAWAAAYNTICIPLALMGLMPAWLAGLGMASSSLLVVGNALRLTYQSERMPLNARNARNATASNLPVAATAMN